MVKPHDSVVALLGLAAFFMACQTLVGLEDKQLDPALVEVTDAGADVEVGVDAEAGLTDVIEDIVSEEEDAGRGARPPSRPIGDAVASGTHRTLTFAVRRFYLGSVDPDNDFNDRNAWRGFGFDYDGECTTKQQSLSNASDTCSAPLGANGLVLEDGHDCRDNTGGHILVEALDYIDPSFERNSHYGTLNALKATIILHIWDIDEGPDDPYAPGRLYVSVPRDGTEKMLWNGKDLLSVDSDSVIGGDLTLSKYELPNAYVRNHIWVSGDFKGPPITVPMMVLDRIATVPTQTATLMVTLDEAHGESTGGMFAAVLDTLALEPFLRLGMLEATGCSHDATDMAMGLFLPNRDLGRRTQESFVTPGEVCRLMSIGVGLDLKPVQPPVTVVEVTPVPSICDEGG